MDIAERVKKVIKEQLDVEDAAIKPEASFIDDLQADSLAIVELLLKFEEEFDIKIPDTVAQNIPTVQAAIDYISKNVKS
ncbi:MAG: acyl carrier protein [Polyangiaceae bacterium]|nr:acyl carrier protein [Polyangiaceae bacterium]